MRHYLITRFCAYWPGNKSYDDPNWLNYRFELYKKYNQKSLENQKNKNFEQLIICDDRITDDMQRYFSNLDYKTKVIVKNEHWKNLVLENIDFDQKFLLTRFDSDDIIDSNFIKLIQESAYNINTEDALIDIAYLKRYSLNNNNLYQQKYKGSSMFATLVCNSLDPSDFLVNHIRAKNNYKNIIRILNLNAYLLIHEKNHYSKEKGTILKKNFNINKNVFKV